MALMKPRRWIAEKFRQKLVHRCHYCRRMLTIETATVDHFIARSRGGENRAKNYRVACKPCNGKKAANTPPIFVRRAKHWYARMVQARYEATPTAPEPDGGR